MAPAPPMAAEKDRARALRVIHWFISRTTERRYEILDRTVFDGGLITRIDEYFDPAEMAPLLDQQPRR
jgi:hypothetical protein